MKPAELSAAKENSDDDKDDCNMCGGSGYLDLERTKVCPNCNGTGKA
jgi:DnaJ-class molecular chaperone